MRNKLLLAAAAGMMLIGACKEKGPLIDLGTAKSIDTTYIVTPPTAQKRNILVEEFTGAMCSNCPDARTALANISQQHDNRLIVLGMHIFNFPQSQPVEGSTHDFRTQDGTDIGNTVYGSINAMPSGGIDRLKIGEKRLLFKGDWSGAITNRINVSPAVNIDLTSNYDESKRTANIVVKVTYLEAVSGKQNLSLAVIEDSLVDKQETPTTIIEQYQFNHVLRDFITPATGITFLADKTQKEAGRVYERSFTYQVDDKVIWNPKKCHIVAFVHNDNGEDKEVLQAVETNMTAE